MSDTVIRVENLGKRYRIGLRQPYLSLRDVITETVMAPFRALARRGKNNQNEDAFIWALNDVSFEVKRGEVLGIIGKNGSGKSTLLKVLTQITEPTEGHATIHGRVASLLEVGTGFHPELTGRDNIFLNGAILGMSRKEIQRKFDEIVAFSEIEKFIDTPVKRYSSGMYVRLAFAVAAHLEPEILLVDEVLAVGDAEFQKKCLGKMGNMSQEGRTVMVVSHNMASIVNLCQRAILLHEGKVIKYDRVTQVVQHYLAAAHSAGGEVVWPDPAQAPGNDIVRLHAVRILQDGMDGPTADVDISKEVLIQIQYWNLREGSLLFPNIWLRSGMGTDVLSSNNARSVSLTEDQWYGRPYPIGLFASICRIPANFLNEGGYSISALLGKLPDDRLVLQEDLLSFIVHDTGEMRMEYYGGWLGVVRPKLAWSTEYIDSIEETVEIAE